MTNDISNDMGKRTKAALDSLHDLLVKFSPLKMVIIPEEALDQMCVDVFDSFYPHRHEYENGKTMHLTTAASIKSISKKITLKTLGQIALIREEEREQCEEIFKKTHYCIAIDSLKRTFDDFARQGRF